MSGIAEERSSSAFLETAAGEAKAFRQKVEAQPAGGAHRGGRGLCARAAARSSRRHAMHLLTLAGNARNHTAQAEESLAALEREAERLEGEMGQARDEQEN